MESCLERLYALQEKIEQNGVIEGMTHRFLIVANKKDRTLVE